MSVLGSLPCIQTKDDGATLPWEHFSRNQIHLPQLCRIMFATSQVTKTSDFSSSEELKQNLNLSTTSQIQSSLLPKGFSGTPPLRPKHNPPPTISRVSCFFPIWIFSLLQPNPPNWHLQTMTFLWTVQRHGIPRGFGHRWGRHGEA